MLMSILGFLFAAAFVRADEIPQRFKFDRYAAMLDHSPFAVATAVASYCIVNGTVDALRTGAEPRSIRPYTPFASLFTPDAKNSVLCG